MHELDKGGKWLIHSHGDSILRLTGVTDIPEWTARQAEPVEPRRLPDGMIEVRRRGQPRPTLYVVELSTYAYPRLAKQASDDALLVYLQRGVVPEVAAIVLRPRGRKPVPRELTIRSEEGSTTIHVRWKVVEVWRIPAEQLLAAGDIGLIPLVPLAHFDGPIEPILDECRERIDRDAPEQERENLRVVTHFFAGLKYNDPRLFQKLGGKEMLSKYGSPVLREIIEEETREARREARREGSREMAETGIAEALRARFGPDAEAVKGELAAVGDDRLKRLFGLAATCPDLAAFRKHLARSRAGKRRT